MDEKEKFYQLFVWSGCGNCGCTASGDCFLRDVQGVFIEPPTLNYDHKIFYQDKVGQAELRQFTGLLQILGFTA